MAVNITYNGVLYSIPTRGELNWDSLNTYLIALGASLPAGGVQALTSELDFGAAFGVKSIYYKSRTANPAAAGQVRLANGDTVSWRNVANSADLALTTNASNRLALAGVEQADLSSTQTLTNKTLTSPILTTPAISSPALSGTATGTAVLPSTVTHTQPVWITVSTMLGTWVTPSAAATNQGAAAYRIDTNGVVWLRGSVGAGTVATAAFTLPAGFRPTTTLLQFAVISNNALGVVNIDSSGNVTPQVGSATYFSLAGIAFSTI